MKNRIYISGPISGIDYKKAFSSFGKAEQALRKKFGRKVEITNPMMIVPKGTDWDTAMKTCIKAMMDCNYIHMLPGIEQSKGARLEVTIANALHFGICDENYNLVEYGE